MIAVEVPDVIVGPISEKNFAPELPSRAIRNDGDHLAARVQSFRAPPKQWIWIDHMFDDVGQHDDVVRRIQVGFDIGTRESHGNATTPRRRLLGSCQIGLNSIDEARKLIEPEGEPAGPTSDIEYRRSGRHTLAHEVPSVEIIDPSDVALVPETLVTVLR